MIEGRFYEVALHTGRHGASMDTLEFVVFWVIEALDGVFGFGCHGQGEIGLVIRRTWHWRRFACGGWMYNGGMRAGSGRAGII